MEPAHRALVALLKGTCFGADAARPERVIRRMMAERGFPTTLRRLFYLVGDLRCCHFFVGSGTAGYFWPATREEFAAAIGFHASRFEKLRQVNMAMKSAIGLWRAEPHPAVDGTQGQLFANAAAGSRP
ncbi:MAG TPA: hypothetical protein VMY35_18810 [Phycisphaerae bacterium]|nr:hypothetical protein [Phycisphaerae bacterium]